MIRNFFGNAATRSALENMLERDRVPQTLLLSGPEGVGKATLARRFASVILNDHTLIEQDDLSLPDNQERLAEREKLPSEKRADEPLVLASNPDFLSFPPDGPMRQISIQQMRLLKERASFTPRKGRYRVFLIDQLDRANEQAANSLLKTLEEPPDHLILVATAENPYDLLPTIRSRAVMFQMNPLSDEDIGAFAASRGWAPTDRRVRLAAGCPGLAVTLDLDVWDTRRERMLSWLDVASGQAKFSTWVKYSETISASKSEKLEYYIKVLYSLIEDILLLLQGRAAVRNPDLESRLSSIARSISFEWVEKAVRKLDDLVEMARRNIQKGAALDALAVELRASR